MLLANQTHVFKELQMKLNQIALAVITLAAGSANAANLNANLTINLDGATALKKTVDDVAKFMCKSNGIGTTLVAGVNVPNSETYSEGSDKKISGVFCPNGMDASSGLPAVSGTGSNASNSTLKVFMSKNNADGSLETFVRALMRTPGQQTKVLDPTQCDTVNKTCATKFVDAQGGFSDVDERVAEARGDFIPSAVVGSYTIKRNFAGQGFGVAVTDKLYKALQEQQGLNLIAGCTVAPGLTTDACTPSLTKQQFTSILSTTGGYKADWSPILPAVDGSDTKIINLCRRVTTSGTQSSMDIYFLNTPCAKANPTNGALDSVRAIDFPADGSNGMAVIENGGTSDVINCLSRRDDKVNEATAIPAITKGLTNADGGAEDEYAIGVISLENLDGKSGTEGVSGNWHFVKLDGINPREDVDQRKSVVEGRYNFAFEAIMAYRNDSATQAKTYMSKMTDLMKDPVKVSSLTGIFVVPGTSLHSTFPTRVHRGTQGGNSCQAFELVE